MAETNTQEIAKESFTVEINGETSRVLIPNVISVEVGLRYLEFRLHKVCSDPNPGDDFIKHIKSLRQQDKTLFIRYGEVETEGETWSFRVQENEEGNDNLKWCSSRKFVRGEHAPYIDLVMVHGLEMI